MTNRRLQLLVAGAFLLGIVCVIIGFVVELSWSDTAGQLLLLAGAISIGLSRLTSRRRDLYAP